MSTTLYASAPNVTYNFYCSIESLSIHVHVGIPVYVCHYILKLGTLLLLLIIYSNSQISKVADITARTKGFRPTAIHTFTASQTEIKSK